jgi:dipeptidyl aminopeptidase/acylaminoacyl peptidase
MVGDPVADRAMLTKYSPITQVDSVRVPVFIAMGKNDPRVSIKDSDKFVEALKERGIEVHYMVKENEGHGYKNEENRFDFYSQVEKFLARHLGGRVSQQ